MPDALGRIAELRRLVPGTVLVQVDGGVHADNARTVRDAGADLLVAGSAIFWQDDPCRRLPRPRRGGTPPTTSRPAGADGPAPDTSGRRTT